jgi:hypothetical protein
MISVRLAGLPVLLAQLELQDLPVHQGKAYRLVAQQVNRL